MDIPKAAWKNMWILFKVVQYLAMWVIFLVGLATVLFWIWGLYISYQAYCDGVRRFEEQKAFWGSVLTMFSQAPKDNNFQNYYKSAANFIGTLIEKYSK